jgi:hypothetical protein
MTPFAVLAFLIGACAITGTSAAWLQSEGCPLGVAIAGGVVYGVFWPVFAVFTILALIVNLIPTPEDPNA